MGGRATVEANVRRFELELVFVGIGVKFEADLGNGAAVARRFDGKRLVEALLVGTVAVLAFGSPAKALDFGTVAGC